MKIKKLLRAFTMMLALLTVVTAVILPVSAGQGDVSQNDPHSPSGKAGGSSSGGTSTVQPSGTNEVATSTPKPTVDFAVQSGKTYELLCYATSGGSGVAYINGVQVNLKESKKGNYTATYILPEVSGVKNLGYVEYAVSVGGKTVRGVSEGQLHAVGSGASLTIQVIHASVTGFTGTKTKNTGFVGTLKKGAVDQVTEYNGTMYYLSGMGAWVEAGGVRPLTTTPALTNNVSGVNFQNTSSGELYTLLGTSHPPYTVRQTKESLTLTFVRTYGVPNIDSYDSALFSSIDVVENEKSTTITFNYASTSILWGYLVYYNGGETNILLRRKPQSSGSSSLSGITIMVDAGHGGKDKGATGLGSNGNAVEKDINLANALEVKRQLEQKGATVLLTRGDDRYIELSDRVGAAQDNGVDLFISLHCNSSSNTKATGTEVFYYEPNSYVLAATLSKQVSGQNSRPNRGAKHSCFVVTLNSYAPSVLVEVGFMTNVGEYQNLRSSTGVSQTAKGVTDGVVAMFNS